MSWFISLEGPDGCGKSTQARLLAEHLETAGHNVLLTREPGGTDIGNQVRQVLFSLDNAAMRPRAEFLLFSASRAQLVGEVIQPHLQAGGVVVSDRFADSSLAYQGYGHGLPLDELRETTRFVVGGLLPDLTILLDLPVAVGLSRRREHGNWNRLDDYELAFHERARAGYLELAEDEPNRWQIINADQSIEAVEADVQQAVATRMHAAPQDHAGEP